MAAGGPATLGAATGALPATAARDAAMPELASTTASANSLQTLAGLLGSSSSSSQAASASTVAVPAPPMPSAVDHGSHDESPVHEDLGLDDPGADPSQASISA